MNFISGVLSGIIGSILLNKIKEIMRCKNNLRHKIYNLRNEIKSLFADADCGLYIESMMKCLDSISLVDSILDDISLGYFKLDKYKVLNTLIVHIKIELMNYRDMYSGGKDRKNELDLRVTHYFDRCIGMVGVPEDDVNIRVHGEGAYKYSSKINIIFDILKYVLAGDNLGTAVFRSFKHNNVLHSEEDIDTIIYPWILDENNRKLASNHNTLTEKQYNRVITKIHSQYKKAEKIYYKYYE